MSLRNLSIATRSGLAFGLIVILVIVLGAVSLVQMSGMRGSAAEVETNWVPSITALQDISKDIYRLRATTLLILADRKPPTTQQTLERATVLLNQITESEKEYEKLISSQEERALYDELHRAQALYLTEREAVLKFAKEGDYDSAVARFGTGALSQTADTVAKLLEDLGHLNEAGVQSAVHESADIYASAQRTVIGLLVLVAALTAVLALVITRSIVTPLGEAVRATEVVAAGDLTQDIIVVGRDEPARLLAALKTMQQSLRGTIQSIADSSNQLASASEELHAVTEDSTRGLHQQNTEIEQAATAVNEMTAAVEEVARNAVSTSEASGESNATALQGREQVRQTVDSIGQLAADVTTTSGEVEQLAQRVHEISKVLDVIRSIAEQTNLLALNAAIEAARAGDAGRGFAVVADEVRALAHRTQQSTQEIEQMIGGIQSGTDRAVSAMQNSNGRARSTLEVAQAAGVALEQITQAISSINERNLVIASASEEQAQVAREVDRNLVNIRDLSLQTSAGANQTSAASQELSRLAIDLNNLVARFKV
ncbi:methyl-accepting chemotaxis protein [Ectopseudomonas alcaliphila]|uniref:Methyl-accepting chemotaxis protein n=1 Tax=Ectopseudomonas alcaliphila TaxID=101564 RepID=A0A1G7F188_9GAMM|nr:methyl-accepting chemotaxis protein [Pseudomonas alcaliphila]MDX5990982.1 methyl-accepting chemotaxis protein [Pseudomonas alcaliphila]SDE69708.1 methyl-accepting chemotaxis protein [Pseudomonas alcaliphila]